ncbi:HAD family acid phosphatase [Dickeya chrysanthemi]|uniref:phosphatase domain-containing protein n=1 Tax=Dickeya chrysanthemi TaxID=556 RepID=UPI001CF5DDC8|nr:HAD family acid phosphatase [Dickeya chrysanthemi]MCA7006071.1 hypothetical protein [Dickeya chrysanthemi]
MKKAIIFDLDGTLANIDRRRNYLNNNPGDWDGFFKDLAFDEPNEPIIMLYKLLSQNGNQLMIIVSGRPDRYKKDTISWLKKHSIIYDKIYMRRDGDKRPDYQVKEDILDEIMSKGMEVILSIDDRDSVVKMWRNRGITCLQCADGNF